MPDTELSESPWVIVTNGRGEGSCLLTLKILLTPENLINLYMVIAFRFDQIHLELHGAGGGIVICYLFVIKVYRQSNIDFKKS